VFADLGVICIGPDVEAGQAKLLNSITAAATSEKLTQISMESSGNDSLSRTSFSFFSDDGKPLMLDFIDRVGGDLRVSVSADDPHLRERFTNAIWGKLAPQLG